MHAILQIPLRIQRVIARWSAAPVFVRALAAITFAASACSSTPDLVVENGRKIRRSALREVWRRPVDSNDTLFAIPSKLLLLPNDVVVLDPAAARVVALSRSKGEKSWAFGASGGGPGEMRTPSDIIAGPDGHILVFDPGNGKVLELSADGRFLGERKIGSGANLRSVCTLGGGALMGYQLDLTTPLTVVAPTYLSARPVPFPWKVVLPTPKVGASGLDLGEFVRETQSVLAPAGPGRCIVARQTASGVALVDSSRVVWTNEVIEAPPLDSLRSTTSTAIAVAVVGDTAFVAYHGIGMRRGRLIDLYSTNTGRYLESWETPTRMSWISANRDGIAVLRSTASGASISLWSVNAR